MSTEKEITIYDIAQFLNISATTVSRGLKDHPTINKNTRKKIADAAKSLGYRSNTFASSLRSKRTHTIGVMVPRLNSYFMSSALAGMEDAARAQGYNLIISQSSEDADMEIENADMMFNKRVDGLLVSLAYNTRDTGHFEQFLKKGIPIVFFDRTTPNIDSTNIQIDNRMAAYNITKHLIEQGCKRIIHLGGNMLRNVYSERLAGFKQALKDHNIKFEDKLLYISKLDEEDGVAAAKYILGMKQRPDAIFSANDTCAIYCMIHLQQEGIVIPDDIAVAGFNNDPISKVIKPNLTTVNYSGRMIGETAAKSLMAHLNKEQGIQATNSIILRSEIVIRGSSLKKK